MPDIRRYSPQNIKDVFDHAKSMVRTAITGFGYTVNSSGTVSEGLDKPIDPNTGYWEQNIGSKAPRWILHVDLTAEAMAAKIATNDTGQEFASSRQIGYLNNHAGTCAVFMSRIRLVFKKADGTFVHFDDWEWLLALSFARPLLKGTSGERLTDFDSRNRSIKYQGNDYKVAFVGLVTSSKATQQREIDGKLITYAALTKALSTFLGLEDEDVGLSSHSVSSGRERVPTRRPLTAPRPAKVAPKPDNAQGRLEP